MATKANSQGKLISLFSLLRSGQCLIFEAAKKLPENDLRAMVDSDQLSQLKEELTHANYDPNTTLAEIFYIHTAYQLAKSGKVNQVNQMTDLQLRLAAYGQEVLSLEQIQCRGTFMLRVWILAAFRASAPKEAGPETEAVSESESESTEVDMSDVDDEEDEKVVLIKNNGVVMRF